MSRRQASIAVAGTATHDSAPHAARTGTATPHEAWADVLRISAAFLVVALHVMNIDQRFEELPVGSLGWIAVDGLISATRWGLPVFVMISGYFLLDPRRELDWSRYFSRRAQRIAWPLLAWTIVYLAIVVCDDMLAGRSVSANALAGLVIKGMPYYHLWYLYMLPGLYLAAPFIKLATDRMTPEQLLAATTICFGFTIFSATMDGLYAVMNPTYIDAFPRYLGYFLAGHLLGRVLTPKLVLTVTVLAISIAAAAGLAWTVAVVLSPARALRVFGFGNPAIIALSLAAFVLIRQCTIGISRRNWLAWAGEASLGIYLVHPAVLDALRHWSYPSTLPVLAMQVAAVFAASLLIVFGLQRTPALRRIV